MVYKNFKTINDFNLKGKTVLLRIDINSAIVKGKPVLAGRVISHSKTISTLQKKGARIVILAHQSRPGKSDFTSLKNHVKLLNKYVKVDFISSPIISNDVATKIFNLKNGEAILLENIRMEKEEFNLSNDNKLITFFKNKIDYYINDAFSICHRKDVSIFLLPKYFTSCIGPVLEEELKNVDKVKDNISKSLFILGGNKVSDIQLLIKKNKILPTGILSLLVLKSSGYDIGSVEDKILKSEYEYLPLIKKNKRLFVEPVDLAYILNKKRVDVEKKDFPVDSLALDIGKKTVEVYKNEIKKVKYLFWKGTAGDTSKDEFSYGTRELLKAIEKSNVFCVAAGGHSETAIRKYKINTKKFGYVSLSGGALVHYVAGKKLPGLEVLKVKK